MLSARAQQGQDVGLRGRDERHDNNQRRQHTSEHRYTATMTSEALMTAMA